MATDNARLTHAQSAVADIDPSILVTRKPSALPVVYDYLLNHEETTPRAIRCDLEVSKSVTHSSLGKLQAVGLVEKVGRGVYTSADIALPPESVYALGELRSEKQYQICMVATEVPTFDAVELSDRIGGSRSNVRATAVRLHETGFLHRRGKPFEKSPKRYRVTEKGRRALRALDVEAYRGCDWSEAVAYPNGIEGTDFLTPYEVEDAYYMTQSKDEWVRPKEIATVLGKNRKKTRKRFSHMEARGLITGEALREKMVFEATGKTRSLMRNLKLYGISKAHTLDFCSIANRDDGPGPLTTETLYARLVDRGYSPTIQSLYAAIEDLKHAGLINGNSRSGYSFSDY